MSALATFAEFGSGAGGVGLVVTAVLGRLIKNSEDRRKHDTKQIVDESIAGIRREMSSRFDKNDEDSRKAAEAAASTREKVIGIEARLNSELGGNSGGLREKVNTVGIVLDEHIKQANKNQERVDAAILHLAEKSQP